MDDFIIGYKENRISQYFFEFETETYEVQFFYKHVLA
jgi:hypothetical protein